MTILTEAEFNSWFDKCNFPRAARQLIKQIRESEPHRRVQSNGKNTPVRYASKKMGVIIQAESRRVEFPQLIGFEIDPNVHEIYDQPWNFQLHYKSSKGTNVSPHHTPDFFLIKVGEAGFIECKTEENLRELAEKMPNRYQKDENGQWRCPPGEEYAAQYGLFYRVLSDKDINWIFLRNVEFVGDYWLESALPVEANIAKQVKAFVEDIPGIRLDVLRENFPDLQSDIFFKLIADKQIYVNLYKTVLSEPESVEVFATEEIALSYVYLAASFKELPDTHELNLHEDMTFSWDDRIWKILNVGRQRVSIMNEDSTVIDLTNEQLEAYVKKGKIVGLNERPKTGAQSEEVKGILAKAGIVGHERAVERQKFIGTFLDDDTFPPETGESDKRYVRRWKKRFKQAQALYGYGYIGLFDNFHNSGNRKPRLSDDVQALMDETIKNDYENDKNQRRITVYRKLRKMCEERMLDAPSYKTFSTRCETISPRAEQTKKRQGKRAAYKYEVLYLDQKTPRHGERAWQIGHIDHTQFDILLVHSETKKVLGKPWGSALVDAYSREILATYTTYDPPSARTLMMLLRECVRLHGRLPEFLVVDNGKEFSSIYFESLLARYSVNLIKRPPAEPRFGGLVERIFGTGNTEFVHNLKGNTQLTKNPRQLTISFNPKTHAIWDIERFHLSFQGWVDMYNKTDHPALGQSPIAAYEASLASSGLREHKLIPYDSDFRMMTMFTTSKGTAKVQPGTGVRVNYIDYWSDLMRNPKVEGTSVEVKYDPNDVSYVYARINGHWVQCMSVHSSMLKGKTLKYIEFAAKEMRKQRSNHNREYLNRTNVAKFLQETHNVEVELMAEKNDEEIGIKSAINHGKNVAEAEINPTVQSSDDDPATTSSAGNEKSRKVSSKPKNRRTHSTLGEM